MELTKRDRLILRNQYRILEKIDPQMADTYKAKRIALESGYPINCEDILAEMSDMMPEEDCQEVIDILEMYRGIAFAYREHSSANIVDDEKYKFPGFDGNNESDQYGYCCYCINDLGLFKELKYGMSSPDLNSHGSFRTLSDYQRMLKVWRECVAVSGNKTLDMDQVESILEA